MHDMKYVEYKFKLVQHCLEGCLLEFYFDLQYLFQLRLVDVVRITCIAPK